MTNPLNKEKIHTHFKSSNKKIETNILKTATSTNDVAKKLIFDEADTIALVATNKQTAGRGRQGKPFYSKLDQGLYFSLAFQPKENKIEDVPLYTILVATALVETLEKYLPNPLAIKWVNDIFYNQRKVIGILSEMVTKSEKKTQKMRIIIGSGINLAGHFREADDKIQRVAGTLFGSHIAEEFDQNTFLNEFLEKFLEYHENFNEKAFMNIYRERLLGLNQKVEYLIEGRKEKGIIRGVDEAGHLMVEKSDQTIEHLYGQEIHFGSEQFISTIKL